MTDLMLMPKMTARTILDALRQRHRPRWNGDTPNWVLFEELSGHPSFNPRRIDLWAMNCWESKREMVAYEVKVSRSDFLHEMKQPQKRRYALMYSNKFFFATPIGLIRHEELPPEAGLVEVDAEGKCHEKVPALWRDCYPPSWNFVASLGRRMNANMKEAQG